MDSFIRRKATGTQEQFCSRLCISRSLLNSYIHEMRELGFPVKYDKKRKTYYYEEDGQIVNELFQKRIPKDEMKNYNGGGVIVQIY
ncbi:hypothetical protein SIO70_02235 [Chitinophaga sancti]|uniref:hypothetical protein n=1 Tax=Chitinophaga sancti TaxID=1004 RepID=UPI002A7644BB|nr:hypothetical protein [Chitinophaga sancti]WPQ63678.1 hypothetical protein SIO70_02235 [Chitinophaga sancti]